MKILSIVITLCLMGSSIPSYAITIADGDYSQWTFGTAGTATVTREAFGGNPDARLNVTTASGTTVYGTAIKNDFSTDQSLSRKHFQLQLDVLSGPGAFGEGQEILLLIEQSMLGSSSIYALNLGITGFPLNWDRLSFNGSFNSFHNVYEILISSCRSGDETSFQVGIYATTRLTCAGRGEPL